MRSLASISVTLLLLTACTPTDAPERPKKSSKSSAAAKPTIPAPAVADSPTEAPTPTPPPAPITQWWCVCYQSEAEAGPQPTTSCRVLESECRKLESRINKGGRGLVAGSISHACRLVSGEHPGDSLGGRDRWQPSQRAGAWTSEGTCLLDGAAPTEAGAADDSPNFDVLMNEALGQLRLGMESVEVLGVVGSPVEKGEILESEATGDFEQAWEYPDAGLTLYMSAGSRGGPQTLGSLRAHSNCTLQTRRGVGIGSDWATVEKAYGNVHDQEGLDPDDNSVFTAGSVYGGVFFMFEAGKVNEIFMGAGAE